MASGRRLFEQEYLACVRHYWSHYAVARETDGEGRPGRYVTPGGMLENTFYYFDSEAVTAMRHALEDLALEEANGSVLSLFPNGQRFEGDRERYMHLAATVDRVDVWVAGTTPRSIPHLRFIKDTKGRGKDYRLTLYEGRLCQAVVICRQTNQTKVSEDRRFEGFYSFNPQLVGRVRQEIDQWIGAKSAGLKEFQRCRLIDQVNKQIKSEFNREQDVLQASMQRLLLEGDTYRADHFESDWEQGLSRLVQLKNRLPKILARTESR